MWIFSALSITGVIGSIAKIAASFVESLSPLIKGFFELVVWYVNALWEGFKDVIDNASTLIFLATVIVASGWYFRTWDNTKVETRIVEKVCPTQKHKLSKNYTPPPKVVVKQPEYKNIFDQIFSN